MAVNDENTEMKPSSVVSRISRIAKPSTPNRYCAPTEGIHSAWVTNWNSGPSVR